MDPLGGDGSGDGDVERRGAGRGRGRGSWAPMTSNTQEFQLRRPHHAASGNPVTAGSVVWCSDQSFDDIIKNSTLSVHAAEFIPKCHPADQTQRQQQGSRMPHKHSVQDRLQMARERSNHSQHQDHRTQDYGQYDGGAGDYKDQRQESSGDEDHRMMDFVNTTQQLLNAIQSLILNPGRFTSLVPSLVNNLRPHLEFPSQFRQIVEIIIQQSINEGNFRYSGARLCATLDASLTAAEQSSFRDTLYTLCKEETESQACNWQQRNEHTEGAQKKCHGLILFLAELVTQMGDTPTLGLGELLIQLITVVLKNPASNSVKHICQALKLAGQTLERDKRGKRKEMENMMRALTELVTAGSVDVHVGRMVRSVNELRNENWGQSTSASDTPTVPTTGVIETQPAFDEPVLYGPDGQILSAEENEFLKDLADSGNDDAHLLAKQGYVDGEWVSEDEDEVDAEYEKFLKTIPQKIQNKGPK